MGLALGAWRFSPAPRGYVHFNVGHETRPAHLRKRRLKQVPRGPIMGLAVSAKRLLEEIRRRMVRVENPRVGPTPQIEGSEVEGHVAFY